MRFKLDENLSGRLADLFRDAGHDVESVRNQGLGGAADADLFERCVEERRCLVTLDLDFSDRLRFPPQRTTGIVILRHPRKVTMAGLTGLLRILLDAVRTESVESRVWIVEPGRIRIRDADQI